MLKNYMLKFVTPDFVHSPERMGQIFNFVGIMGGVPLDLVGQENAESCGNVPRR